MTLRLISIPCARSTGNASQGAIAQSSLAGHTHTRTHTHTHTRHEFPVQWSSLWWRRFIGALTLTGQSFCSVPCLSCASGSQLCGGILWVGSLLPVRCVCLLPVLPGPKKGVATACCVPATRRPDRRPERNQLSSMPQALPRRRGADGAHEAHPQGPERLRSCQ